MKIREQKDFFRGDREHGPDRSVHGGTHDKGRRKTNRPFRKNQAQHLVLKSSVAKGRLSMLSPNFRIKIEQILVKYAEAFQLKLHEKQNVGTHLHLIASASRKQLIQKFLRTVSGLIARLVTGAKKGKPFGQKFWDEVVFSRLIHGARDYKAMINYVFKNYLEAEYGSEAREAVEAEEAETRKARRRKKSSA